MRSDIKKIITIFIILGTIFAFSLFISKNLASDSKEFNSSDEYINSSAISGKIHIDSNWTAAKFAGVCTGNGTYSEPYFIKDLVIDGGSSGSCILIENSDAYFKIENCTVYNSGYPNSGIRLSNVTNAQLIDNNCSSNYRGIYVIQSKNNTISNNTVNYINGVGIYFTQSTNNTIFNNTINFTDTDGVYLTQSNNNTISNNTISFNDDDGICMYSSDYNKVSGNIVSNSDSGIYLTYSEDNIIVGNTASNNYYNGIRLGDSDWTKVMSNIVKENDDGIYIYSTNYAIVSGNNATNNDCGIELSHSYFNDFSGNDASNNMLQGIYLYSSNYNNVSGNFANNNDDYGSYLYGSDYNYFSGNFFNNNGYYGIYLYFSDNNNVSNNTNNDNGYTGIYLYSSDYNIVSENTASSQRNGISLLQSEYNSLLGNTINNNNFYGVYLVDSHNNNIEGNFINYNNIGIYEEYTRYKKHIIEFIDIESADNQISNNNFNGNTQDVRRITNVITHPSESLITLIITLLSIATGIIAIGALTAELIRKQRDFRENEEYRRSKYGIAAIIVESVGALIFILSVLFLMPIESTQFLFFSIDSIMVWLFILIPFAIAGIIIGKEGLKNDKRNGLAKLGMGFGIPLLILGAFLIVIVIVIAIIVIAVIYAFIASGGW